jgi:hypothetical protein
MKFGKQIAMASLPAWSDFYFHYSAAKELIKRKLEAVREAAATAVAAANATAAANAADPAAGNVAAAVPAAAIHVAAVTAEAVEQACDVMAVNIRRQITLYDGFTERKLQAIRQALADIMACDQPQPAEPVSTFHPVDGALAASDGMGSSNGAGAQRRQQWDLPLSPRSRAATTAVDDEAQLPAMLHEPVPTASSLPQNDGGGGSAGGGGQGGAGDSHDHHDGDGDSCDGRDDAEGDSCDGHDDVPAPAGDGDYADDASLVQASRLTRLERQLNELMLFVQINSTAVLKITKKFDKKFAKLSVPGLPAALPLQTVAGGASATSTTAAAATTTTTTTTSLLRSPLSPAFAVQAQKTLEVRLAQIAEVRVAHSAAEQRFPPPPMLREGELSDPDSVDFGVTSNVRNVDSLEIGKMPVAAITNLSLVRHGLVSRCPITASRRITSSRRVSPCRLLAPPPAPPPAPHHHTAPRPR